MTTETGHFDRTAEIKAFDDTKLGVQGLVDAKVANIPEMFVRSADELAEEVGHPRSKIGLPVIDLRGIDHEKTVSEMGRAAEEWGFFQVVNHGVARSVMDNMIEGVRKFNEQHVDVKKQFYSRDLKRRVRFNSNHDLYKSKRADWRDTLSVSMLMNEHIDPGEVPQPCSLGSLQTYGVGFTSQVFVEEMIQAFEAPRLCLVVRNEAIEFIEGIKKVGDKVYDFLSEALGLKPEYLRSIECNKGRTLVCHYYPACPEPDLAMGVTKHTDNTFLTILVQDLTGGLQVLHGRHWVDVVPIPGSLVVNIGDLFQIVSNDRFKSNVHRVIPSRVPRISVICFFAGRVAPPARRYGPIEELLSEQNPPRYKELLMSEYVGRFFTTGLQEKPCLEDYRI